MSGDRARVSFDPSRKWRGLVAQQGRVTLEADWNEAASIDQEHDRRVALEVVGRAGTPDSGYSLTPVRLTDSPPTGNLGDFTIGKGILYVGGQRLDLDGPVAYSAQPEWLDHSTDPLWIDPTAVVPPVPTPSTTPPAPSFELVYLLASEQEVCAVEDPALADIALGGPDTMQRQRILQHFVRQPSQSGTCDGAWTAFTGSLPTSGLQFDKSSMMIQSATKLQVSFPEIPTAPSLCQPVATGGYLGAENQMIRVMVTGVDASSGVPIIVWGFDDASFLYRITKTTYDATANATTLLLASSPPDCFHFPAAGQAVEVLRSAAQLTTTDYIAAPTGIVSTLTTPYDNTQKTLTIADQLPADYVSKATTPQLYLRVWQANPTLMALPATLSGPGQYSVELDGTGVAVTLTSSTGVFHPGDFWRFALRPIQPAVVYPARISEAPQPPDGPRTWASPLAVLTWEDGNPTVSSCVRRFDSLVELTGSLGGCCTRTIGPGDVDDGAALAKLLDSYANTGSVTICLRPGTYTLSEPLAFGPELGGLTLQGCQPGVVLKGPSQPGSEFGLGLIAMQATQAVTIRGIELVAPLVALPPADAFSTLARGSSNEVLMQTFARGLQVAVGISADGCTDLTIEDCTFDLPDPGPANTFGAGIYATGAIEGFEVKGCTFWSVNPPATAPFNSLAAIPVAGNQVGAPPPYQLTFGYLQVPSNPAEPQQNAPQILHDATLERNLFEGVTIAAFVMARLGTLRIDTNTVRNTYGGFWLVSISEAAQTLMFDQQNVGDTRLYPEFAGVGIAALRDAIFMLASQVGQLLLTTGPGATPATPSDVAAPTDAHLTIARHALTTIHARAQATAGVAITGLPEATRAALGLPAALSPAIVAQSTAAVPVADTGISVSLRLDIRDCQIDAIIADSYSGAGLLVVDLTPDRGSAVVHGNRIRSRFPMGESVLFSGLGVATVTGNIVANEIATPFPFTISPPQFLTSYSMVLNPAGAATLLGVLDPSSAPFGAAVAITGNVFVDPAILPARAPTKPPVQAPLNDWMFFNTETDYGLAAPPAVSGVDPQGGLASGATEVDITGGGFTGVTAVTFGATAAPFADVKFISDSHITAISPAGFGTVDVTVTTPAGTSGANPNDRFTYLGVAGVSPNSGAAGSTVQVIGSGFTGATAVQFGPTAAAMNTVQVAPDGTSLTVTVPAGSGQVDVTVTTPLGTSPSVPADKFTYKAKEGKEGGKDGKEHKDHKDIKDKDKEGKEKDHPDKILAREAVRELPEFTRNPLMVDRPIAADGLAVGRAFIAPEERPAVGLNALRDGEDNR